MICSVKQLTHDYLIKKGFKVPYVIQKLYELTDHSRPHLGKSRENLVQLNEQLTKVAKEKYGVTTEGTLLNINPTRKETDKFTFTFRPDFVEDFQQKYEEFINNKNQNSDTFNQENTLIKPGLSELFENNPTLANEVYQALGFEKKNIEEYKDVVDKQTYQYLDRIQQLENWKTEPQPINVKNLDTYIKKITLGTQKDKYEVNVYENGIEVNKYFDTKKEAINEALEYSNYYTRQYNNIIFKNVKDRNDYLDEEIKKVVDKANENEDFRQYYAEVLGSEITPQQKQEAQIAYSNYLDTIFPDSKVKDIVYRGKSDDKLLSKAKGVFGEGIYFSSYKQLAERFGNLNYAIINVTNPNKDYYFHPDFKEKEGYKSVHGGIKLTNNEDGIIGLRRDFKGDINEYVVFEPEQIHILSSKSDIQGFKDYMSFENSKVGNAENMQNYMNSKSVDYIMEKLIQSGKIEKKC